MSTLIQTSLLRSCKSSLRNNNAEASFLAQIQSTRINIPDGFSNQTFMFKAAMHADTWIGFLSRSKGSETSSPSFERTAHSLMFAASGIRQAKEGRHSAPIKWGVLPSSELNSGLMSISSNLKMPPDL